MRRWARRIGIGVATVAALYVVLIGIGGGVALALALTPGFVDWSQSHQPVPKDPLEINYRGDPRTALGLDFETVHYDTELGPAEAWLVPAAAPSRTWAVFVHGIGGLRENGYRQLTILHQAGIPVMLITYRNDTGAPPGKPPFYSFGLNEWHDLDAAVGWIAGHGADHVILVGESMGGAITGQFLAHSPRAALVSALVLDAPALDANTVADWMLGQFRLPFGDQMASLAMHVASIWSPVPLAEADLFEAVARFPGPVFLAHGRSDKLVPVTLSQKLVTARQAPTTYLETNADHLHSYREQPDKYRSELLAFLAALPKS